MENGENRQRQKQENLCSESLPGVGEWGLIWVEMKRRGGGESKIQKWSISLKKQQRKRQTGLWRGLKARRGGNGGGS